MWTLLLAEPQESYGALASDVAGMAHGSYGTELVRELSAEEHADSEIFDLLKQLYQGLLEVGPKAGRLRVFELTRLRLLGLTPQLTRCSRCQEALGEEELHWVPARGGALCKSCSAEERSTGVRPISTAAIDYLITAQALTQLAQGDALEGRPEAVEARQAMLGLLYWHVGKPLKSVEFIAKLSNKG